MATSKQWRDVKALADGIVTYSCILELSERIEALEAKNQDEEEAWAAMRRASSSATERIASLVKRIEALEATHTGKSSHPAKPDSSLVERVAFAIIGDSDELINWKPEARAAIRAVAAWMTSNPDHHFPPALVFALDKEAEHR